MNLSLYVYICMRISYKDICVGIYEDMYTRYAISLSFILFILEDLHNLIYTDCCFLLRCNLQLGNTIQVNIFLLGE